MMPGSQLSPDDLRNVGHALVIHNSLDILPAIKHLRPDPGLRRLLPEHISKIELTKEKRAFCRQTLVQKDSKKKYQRCGLARTAWLIINWKVVSKNFISPANLTEARAFSIFEPSEV